MYGACSRHHNFLEYLYNTKKDLHMSNSVAELKSLFSRREATDCILNIKFQHLYMLATK